MARRYRVVDVFAERAYAGNPLTVVLDADDLTSDQMQAIARETNHSETTFVLDDEPHDGAWPARIFTPTTELPFAGHPTLGTAAVIHEVYDTRGPVSLDLKVGRISVMQEGQTWWMRQNAPTFGAPIPPEMMALALGLDVDDIDAAHPIQAVSTGVRFLIVPLRTLDAARRAQLDLKALRAQKPECLQVLVFAPETESADTRLHVRCFTEALGILEDPATGSANGCLAGYLVKHSYLGARKIDIAVEQGMEIGRPSRLYLKASAADVEDDANIEVNVGGRVLRIAEGTLLA